MKKSTIVMFAVLGAALVSGEVPLALAADPATPDHAAAAIVQEAAPSADAPAAPRAVSPLAARVAEIIAAERAEVDALSERIAATTDTGEILQLQRRVKVVKLKAERDMLAAQLGEARDKAAAEQVAQLEEAIAALDALVVGTEERIDAAAEAVEAQR